MIWHIFKKDLRLLWPLAALMAATQFVLAGVISALGVLGMDWRVNPMPALMGLANELTQVVELAIGVFIVVAVHQDTPCSRNQDWLARPIAGRDMLVAKLLMVVLIVQGPMLLVDIFRGLTNGFFFGVTAEMAILHSLFVMSWTIPVLALAGVTENFVQTIIVVIAAMLVDDGFAILFVATHHPALGANQYQPNWDQNTLGHIVILMATFAVLGLQYFRRAPQIARGVATGAYTIFLLANFLPWDVTLAIQNLISPAAAETNLVSIAFDPSQPKTTGLFASRVATDAQNVANIPVRFTGIAKNQVAVVDRMELRFVDTNGKVIVNQNYVPVGQDHISFVGRKPSPTFMKWNDDADADMNAYLPIVLLPDVYKRLRDQNLRLELRYWLTVSQLATTASFSTVGDDRHAPTFGRCATSLIQTSIQGVCLQPDLPGEDISCTATYLENAAAGLRDPEFRSCVNWNGLQPADVFNFIPIGASSADLSGRLPYPIEPSQIATSRLIASAYKPIAHVAKTLVIPSIRLSDWDGDAEQHSDATKDGSVSK